jgi:hypothetical protein
MNGVQPIRLLRGGDATASIVGDAGDERMAGLLPLLAVAVRAFGSGITGTLPASCPGATSSMGRSRPGGVVLDARYAKGEISTEECRPRLLALQDR